MKWSREVWGDVEDFHANVERIAKDAKVWDEDRRPVARGAV